MGVTKKITPMVVMIRIKSARMTSSGVSIPAAKATGAVIGAKNGMKEAILRSVSPPAADAKIEM